MKTTIDNGDAIGDNTRLECPHNLWSWFFVIENVLPYLLPSDFVRSYAYVYVRDKEDSDSIFDDNDNGDDDDDDDDDGNSSNIDEDNENIDVGWVE